MVIQLTLYDGEPVFLRSDCMTHWYAPMGTLAPEYGSIRTFIEILGGSHVLVRETPDEVTAKYQPQRRMVDRCAS
jgi:hypothetical protein